MRVTATSDEQIVFLKVGWNAYRTLVDDLGDTSAHRIAYDGETLEIMSPSPAHERYIRLLEKLMGLLAHERKIKLESFGSMTMKIEPRGAEPDSSYYVQKASAVIGKENIDLSTDPPPDIALEVDLARSRIDKRAIYASMQIVEYWRYDGSRLRAYELVDTSYVEIKASLALNGLLISEIDRFMEMRHNTDQTKIGESWLEWLSSQA